MAITFALYKVGEAVRKVSAQDISSIEEYHKKYRNHLFCSENGCNAPIELAHREGQPYFRTWRNRKHAEGCKYAFENDPSKSSKRAAETILVRVSSGHKRESLLYSDRKRRQDEGILSTPEKSTGNSRAKRPTSQKEGVRLVATVDPNARLTMIKEKEPSIPTRKCTDISSNDVGLLLNVYGRVTSAVINASSVRYFFATDGGPEVSVLFYNRFRDNSPQHYGWIQEIAKLIICGKITNLPIACLGVCELKGEGFDIQVMDDDSINVDSKWLDVFMRDLAL